jgi:ABC-type glycerol-3-phosphate transport system substrate-binding protein
MIALLILALVLPLTLSRCDACTPPPTVTIWHSFAATSSEAKLLSEGLGVLAAEGSKIALQITAQGDQLGDALAAALKAGALPDIIIAPAEWAPTLDRAQATYRVPLENDDDWLPAVKSALVRQGQLIALPLFCSVAALGRGDQLAAQAWPATMGDFAVAVRTAARAGDGNLHWPVDDLYLSLPFYLGAGGQIEPLPAAGTDPVWEAAPEASASAARRWLTHAATLAELVADRTNVPGITEWQQSLVSYAPVTPDVAVRLQAAGIPFALGPIPEAVPLMTTHAAMVMRDADPLSQAAVELIVRLTADGGDGLIYLSSLLGLLPPMARHFTSEVVAAAGLAGFRPVAVAAQAMPAGKHASPVWAVYEQALIQWRAGAKAEDVVARLIVGVGEVTSGDDVTP